MFGFQTIDRELPVTDHYDALCVQLTHLIEGERDPVANMANAAALLYHQLGEVNWAGFYRWLESEQVLVLGPFHGLPACIRIPSGRGVCGTAVKSLRTLVVADVHTFSGHIACDSASQSEIVVPLLHTGRIVGVMDLDSPVRERFSEEDQAGLERFTRILAEGCDWA